MNLDQYIKDKKWREETNFERRKEILKLIYQCNNSKNSLEKLGGVLLFNQLNEDLIKENIILSFVYITLKIRPKKINVSLNFDNDTFGILIKKFKSYAINEYNYDILIESLSKANLKRNILTHKIMKIKNNKDMINVLDDYLEYSTECMELLVEYLNEIITDIERTYGEYPLEIIDNYSEDKED